MASDLLTCPMCAFEFARTDTLCSHGCPLGALCRMVRCPACEYEFQDPGVGASGSRLGPLRRLWRRLLPWRSPRAPAAAAGGGRGREETEGTRGTGSLEEVRPVTEARPGERVEVLCLGREEGSRARGLAVFGLLPGARAIVLQQRPACVLRVEETELALDREIAEEILVRPAGPESPGAADATAAAGRRAGSSGSGPSRPEEPPRVAAPVS